MKRHTAQWVLKAEDDIAVAQTIAAMKRPRRDAACFHCQQSVEKYLKALLHESGSPIPKTHNLNDLINLLLPFDASLGRLRRGLKSLSRYGVDYRYPGPRATTRELRSAIRIAEKVRTELRTRLGLKK